MQMQSYGASEMRLTEDLSIGKRRRAARNESGMAKDSQDGPYRVVCLDVMEDGEIGASCSLIDT